MRKIEPRKVGVESGFGRLGEMRRKRGKWEEREEGKVSRVSFEAGTERKLQLTRKSGIPAFVEIPAPARIQMLEAI